MEPYPQLRHWFDKGQDIMLYRNQMPKFYERGFIAQVLIMILLLAGIGVGVYLVQHYPKITPSTSTPNPTVKISIRPSPSVSPSSSPIGSNSVTDASYYMGVLVIKYFPVTASGMIDQNITGDVGDSYDVIKKRTDDVTNQLKVSLEKASTYLGYKDSNATPSLKYTIVDTKEYKQPVPLDSTTRKPLYKQIMQDHNICDYVNNKGVREVWLWAYQGPSVFNGLPYLAIWESTMAGPNGFFANGGDENMPVCKNTYRVYTFNYQRYTSEALESWGHQVEAEMDAVDRSLYRDKFQGPPHPLTTNETGRCGSVHNPPNASSEYDRGNPTPNRSDCLDWKPDGLGVLSNISCQNWGCSDSDPVTNNSSLNYQIWLLQNMPGRGNTKTYQSKQLRNWWDIHGDFDNVMRNSRKLTL